jgi:hypothetical protein
MGGRAGYGLTIFERILLNFCVLDKTEFLIFFVHCSVMITFQVIPDKVEKSLILTGFNMFDLCENMLKDMVVDFFSLHQ